MKKTIIIVITLLLCIAVIVMYSHYRSASFEPHYIGYLTVENSNVVKQLNTILQKANSAAIRGDKELAQCLEKQVKAVKQLALIAITSNEYSVLIAAKKDKVINQTLFDAIIADISQKKILPASTFPQVTRYYNNSKFYFFIYDISCYTIITAYTYSLPDNLILKLFLENLLIVVAFIILGTAAIIIFQQKVTIKPEPEITKETKKEKKALAANPFVTLCQQHGLSSVTIVQKNKKGIWKKVYSYPKNKMAVKLDEEILNELLSGTYILLNNNTVLMFYNSITQLIFRLERSNPFKGKTIKEIELYITKNAEDCSNYLTKHT